MNTMKMSKAQKVYLFLWIVTIIGNLMGAQAMEPPEVHIFFPDKADKDFQDDSLIVMTNSNPDFEMKCSASYPVEWIIHYSPGDDGITEETKIAETFRHTDDFQTVKSYTFSAKLRIAYKGNLLVLSNFTCRRVGQSIDLETTHVTMEFQKNLSIIILTKINHHQHFPLGSIRSSSDRKTNCERAVALMTAPLPPYIFPCFRCEEPSSGKSLELDYHECISPIVCESMIATHKKGKSCLQVQMDMPKDCKFYGEMDFNPKMVLCKNFGSALAQFFFFGLFHGDSKDDMSVLAPTIYFDWSDVNQTDMIRIHLLNQTIVYQTEDVSFICEYSRYYFSLGSWFGIENVANNSMTYYKAFDLRPCNPDIENPKHSNCSDTEEYKWRGSYQAQLNIAFNETGDHRVYCFGPVWNTTEWVNTSFSLTVVEGVKPEVVSLKPDGPSEFFLGQRRRRLVCEFKGKPMPNVTWRKFNKTLETTFLGNYTSVREFDEIGHRTEGLYTCVVTSFLGDDSESFLLKIHELDQTGLSWVSKIAISAAVTLVTLIIIAVIVRMWHIIKSQQKELRLLTEAEILEFVEGNPGLLNAVQDDYFDRASVIEALPYDKKYEIPQDELIIDYACILGTGQFGVVLKGKIRAIEVSHYVGAKCRSSRYGTFSTVDELEVAVKICQKNLDVVNFKAVLSEIKVMAYLGSHDNIVGLIGASTNNIRNRELYIAVEYCKNGSLQSYLRLHKEKFNPTLDLVWDRLSRGRLFQWTEEIATGLEYMHSKKIIHADLAIRNVLLTEDLTAKIGDFGLSRQLVDSSSYTKTTKGPLPWRNMSIESLKCFEYSIKSDIWAFGVTLWELFTLANVPYPGLNYTVDFVNFLEQGLRLYKPTFASDAIYNYMLLCWKETPAERPSTAEVKMICRKILKKVNYVDYVPVHEIVPLLSGDLDLIVRH